MIVKNNISVKLIRFSLAALIFGLVMVVIGNMGWFDPNWPFELFVSYVRHILMFSVIGIGLGLLIRSRTTWIVLALALIAAGPFISFGKYVEPSKSNCAPGQCLSLIGLNLHGEERALRGLSKLADEYKPDFIAIFDWRDLYSGLESREYFPDYIIVVATIRSFKGNPAAILIRGGPIGLGTPYFEENDVGAAHVQAEMSETVDIIAIHPHFPLSPRTMKSRNDGFHALQDYISEMDNLIIVGDFNLTPWTPEFKGLPGKRAGDPRFVSTWDAERFWTGIPIDHILISDQLELVEAKILPHVGSDHRPVYAKVRLKR